MRSLKTFLVVPALALTLAVTGCVGQDDGDDAPVSEENSPQEALDLAKKTLDETPGVRLSLKAEDLPSNAPGIILTEASGVAVHPTSFEGDIVGAVSGITQDGEVIAIDGTVWAKIALLGPDFQEIDPGSIGAPDPGQLIATEGGLSDLLTVTEDVAQGDSVRGGANNDEVLTEYSGTLPGNEVTVLVPTATSPTYDVVYQIAGNGELRSMAITGVFYADADASTYTVTFDDYGTEQEITAP